MEQRKKQAEYSVANAASESPSSIPESEVESKRGGWIEPTPERQMWEIPSLVSLGKKQHSRKSLDEQE